MSASPLLLPLFNLINLLTLSKPDGFSEYYYLHEYFEYLGFPPVNDTDYSTCGAATLNDACTRDGNYIPLTPPSSESILTSTPNSLPQRPPNPPPSLLPQHPPRLLKHSFHPSHVRRPGLLLLPGQTHHNNLRRAPGGISNPPAQHVSHLPLQLIHAPAPRRYRGHPPGTKQLQRLLRSRFAPRRGVNLVCIRLILAHLLHPHPFHLWK